MVRDKKVKRSCLSNDKKVKRSCLSNDKKAQVNIIVVLLIILISITGIIIVWNVVSAIVEDDSVAEGIGSFSVGLDVEEAVLFNTGAMRIDVKRSSGGEEVDGLYFTFYDGEKTRTERVDESISELESRTFFIKPQGIDVKEIGVAPVVGDSIGRESKFKGEVLRLNKGVVGLWKFDGSGEDFVGSNDISGGDFIEDGNGKCVEFSDWQEIGEYDFSKGFAISFWLKPSGDIGILKGGDWNISLRDGEVGFKGNYSDDRIDDGEWNNIVISDKMYINGRFNGRVEDLDVEDLEINNGYLDELMIFNESLAHTEIKSLYEMQRSDFS